MSQKKKGGGGNHNQSTGANILKPILFITNNIRLIQLRTGHSSWPVCYNTYCCGARPSHHHAVRSHRSAARLQVNIDIWEQSVYNALIYCTSENRSQVQMERFDPGRYDTAWPTRVHAARLQVDFFLIPGNTPAKMLQVSCYRFMATLFIDKRHLYLKCN